MRNRTASRAVWALGTWAAWLALVMPATASERGGRVAVLPLSGEASGANPFVIQAVLKASIQELGAYELESDDATAGLLETAAGLGLSCAAGDVECLTQVGALAELRWVVVPRLENDDGPTIALSLLDVSGGEMVATERRALSGEVTPLVRGAVFALLAPERFVGALSLVDAPAGALVRVDGKVVGETPLDEPIAVAPGPHTLRVEVDGYAPYEASVDVGIGGPTEVSVILEAAALESEATSGVSPLALGLGGATVVAGLTTVGLFGWSLANEATACAPLPGATASFGCAPSTDTAARQTALALGPVTWLLTLGAAGASVGGGVATALVFAQGGPDESSAPKSEPPPKAAAGLDLRPPRVLSAAAISE